MTSYAVYYVYAEGDREYVESFSDHTAAYTERARLQAQVDADEDAEGVRVIVVEEP